MLVSDTITTSAASRSVFVHERVQVGGAALLFALDDELDVDGHPAVRQQALDRLDLRESLACRRSRRARRVAVARRLEGSLSQVVGIVGGLHIVMPVISTVGASPASTISVHDRVAGRFVQRHARHPDRFEMRPQPLRCPPDVAFVLRQVLTLGMRSSSLSSSINSLRFASTNSYGSWLLLA